MVWTRLVLVGFMALSGVANWWIWGVIAPGSLPLAMLISAMTAAFFLPTIISFWLSFDKAKIEDDQLMLEINSKYPYILHFKLWLWNHGWDQKLHKSVRSFFWNMLGEIYFATFSLVIFGLCFVVGPTLFFYDAITGEITGGPPSIPGGVFSWLCFIMCDLFMVCLLLYVAGVTSIEESMTRGTK